MSSKRRIRRHTCSRKKAFQDEGEAWRVARGQGRYEGRELCAYRCPFSGGDYGPRHWHIGHADVNMSYPHSGKFAGVA